MEEKISLEPSEGLAYWVGVLQTDGTIKGGYKKTEIPQKCRVTLCVGKISLPMLIKFRKLSKQIFGQGSKIFKGKTRQSWHFIMGVKRFLKEIKNLDVPFGDPPTPPQWTLEKPEFFGAYLAGVIDGDGSVCIKRPDYPQCSVKIDSGRPQVELSKAIGVMLKCGVSITPYKSISVLDGRIIIGKTCRLEFLVSSKTFEFFKKFILPYIELPYKRRTIEKYISHRFNS